MKSPASSSLFFKKNNKNLRTEYFISMFSSVKNKISIKNKFKFKKQNKIN